MVKEAIKGVGKAINVVKDIVMTKVIPILIPIVIIAIFVISFFAGAMEVAADDYSSFDGIYGDTVQEKVWFALKDLGYSDIAVAGAIGNIHYESAGFSTVAVEGNGEGIGLIQWSYGRKQNLIAYADSKGVTWEDEDTQIEFLVAEISGQGSAAEYADKRTSGYIGDEGITSTADDWANSTSIEDSTLHFMRFFESPGSKSSLEERVKHAKDYDSQFKGKQKPSGGAEKTSDTPGIRGYYKASCSGRTFTEYYQNDGGAWNWEYGCWVSSQATIMSGFGSKYTPNQLPGFNGLAQQYTWQQYGGVKYERVTNVKASDMKKYLKQGHALHIRVEGRNLITDNGTHYFGGHSLTVLDYKSEGGKDKVYIHDPYKGDPTYGWTDLNKLAGCLNWYEHVWK